MKEIEKLTWQELENAYPPFDFSFKTTDDLECLDEVIGQERAKKAMAFGLSIKSQGYNIYISGEPGTGKTSFAKVYAQKAANKKERPSDWCYVYNFKEKRVPKALSFNPGDGKRFRNDMTELIAYLTDEIPYIYASKEHEDEKNIILRAYKKEKERLIKKIKKHAKILGFAISVQEGGISFVPLDEEGDPVTEEAYEKFPPEKQGKIEKGSTMLQEMAQKAVADIRVLEETAVQEIENLEYQKGLENVAYYIKILKEKYASYQEVLMYLEDLQEDILENIQVFIEEEEEENPLMNLALLKAENSLEKLICKYDVNLLVDHSEIEGAPVLVSYDATCNKIIGQLEYDNEFGTLSTDYMKVKPGLLHRANGGYLILKAEDLLGNYEAWSIIKKAIKTKQIDIENPQGVSITTVASLRPEPIPLALKIILIGNPQIYHLLYANDPDFKNLFKVKVDFESEMETSQSSADRIACFIKRFCKEEFLLPFSREAVKEVLRYARRTAQNQAKLTANLSLITTLLIESNALAVLEGARLVGPRQIQKARKEKIEREGFLKEKLDEQIIKNTIMIQTKGRKVGQINALAVYDTGDYRFGLPVKITATSYKGQSGIINIEKEADLSGGIHTKGIHVIAGYLGQTYAQEEGLSLTCRICFEQSYNKIDGDSASSAELYAVLSSLSDLPIKQNIAVTGSINQHGEIQPVGGVTHKIEGFFRICKKRGLTGDQGVIMPRGNIGELVLNSDVMDAIKNQMFHIYAISHVEEGLQILTDEPYERVEEKVRLKVKKFNKNLH